MAAFSSNAQLPLDILALIENLVISTSQSLNKTVWLKWPQK
jgi:hypothetical protein